MTNLLEDDMAVDVSYKIGANGTLTILAVWLGEKPALPEDEDLSPIYDRKAIVRDVVFSDYIAQSDVGRVLVDKRVVFRDGRRCSVLAEDEEIFFDAVPFRGIHVSGALYGATCAWIGPKPRIVERFGLEAEEPEVELGDIVVGTVVVIANETVALVDVEVDGLVVRVLLFRSSFRPACERIQDAVDVGDTLNMRLGLGCVFPRRKQWFAQVAVKASDEDSAGVLRAEHVIESAVFDSDTESTASAAFDIRAPVISENETSKNDVRASINTETQTSNNEGPLYDRNCEILYSEPPLSGVISKFSSYGHIKHGNLDILADHANFYVNRKRQNLEYFDSFIASGENIVNFEAVRIRRKDSEFSRFSHEATCVWVGKKPAIAVVALSSYPPNLKLLDENNQVFYGIVSKLYFPYVAIIEIPGLSTAVSVHVNRIVAKPRYRAKGVVKGSKGRYLISNFVQLGDCVEFEVEQIAAVPGILIAREVQIECSKEISDLVSAGLLSRKPDTSDETSKPVTQPARSKASTESSSCSPEPDVCVANRFKEEVLSPNRAFLINCTGIIEKTIDRSTKADVIAVKHVFGSSKLTDKAVYISEGKLLSPQSIASLDGRQIRFDAEKSLLSNSGFFVKRIWDVNAKRPPSEVLLYSDLKLFEGVSTRCCLAKIVSIPLHDAAIATVKNVPVMVPFDSLVSLQEINYGRSAIDSFLSVGDFVGVKFERHNFPGEMSGSYFRAEKCWSLSKGGAEISEDDEFRPCTPRLNSWFQTWGYGAFFCEGKLLSLGNKYFVNHETAGVSQNLDIFEKGKVFVDGHLVEKNQFKCQNGKAITYHVAHEHLDALSDDVSREMFAPKGFFVTHSWIGEKPSPGEMLKGVLEVPKGYICSNWCYEVVVKSFPLPTHALCSLGLASVLVPLPQVSQDKKFVSVKDVNLKRGDRVVVRILEHQVGDTTILITNEAVLKKASEMDSQDVLKNVCGKIETPPDPTGLIKADGSGILVSFEVCHVRRYKNNCRSVKKRLKSLMGKIECAQKVIFSAVKVNAKTAPYRAFEVYFE